VFSFGSGVQFELSVLTLLRYRLFYYYKDISGAIYPVLEDISEFENTLELLLQTRISIGGEYRADADEAQKPFGVSIAYLGLLFAVLASGCQSSDYGSKERELTSQVYGIYSTSSVLLRSFSDNFRSLLLLPMSSYDKLPVPTHYRSHPDSSGDWQRIVIQHEPWHFLRLTWNDTSHGFGTGSSC
jgi:hypothetical protein